MRTVLIVKRTQQKGKLILPKVFHFLLVDLVPMVLLLALMAYGMAWVSGRLTDQRSVDIVTISVEHS